MKSISEAMKAYMLTHPFDSGNSDCQTVLDQLYHAYAESHEHDPQEIGDGFKELEELLYVALLMTMSRHDTIPRSLKAKRAWLLKLTTMKSML